MAIDGAATVAGVKPGDKGGDVLNKTGASGRNRCRGASDHRSNDRGGMWNGDNDW